VKINAKSKSGGLFFWGLILILATVHFYQKNLLSYSGDEPRFTYYSYSIVKGEMLKYPIDKFMQETDSVNPSHEIATTPVTLNIFNKTMFMMNSIISPLMYAPALFFGKALHAWELLRTAAFLYYCSALVFMWLSLKTLCSTKESLLALALTTLSLPQLAQMSLGNTEQAAIFFLAAALYLLIFRRITIPSIIIGSLSMCLCVWSSMRSMPLVGSVAIGFLMRIGMMSTEMGLNKRKNIFIFLAISFIGGIGWVLLQTSFTGTLAGSSSLNETFNDKPITWFLYRPFVLMLHHKEGIFLLFPLLFASFLGLINAARQRELVAWISITACVLYYGLIMLTSQNEGYPGRLQFVLIEFFMLGLAFYIRDFKNVAARGLLVLGAIVSSIEIFVHLMSPAALLQNRQFGYFQQTILNRMHLDFGQYLIWDQHSVWTTTNIPLFLPDAWHIIYQVSFLLTALGFLLLVSISTQYSRRIRKASGAGTFFLVLIGLFSLVVSPVQSQRFTQTNSFIDGYGSTKITFNKPIGNKATITLGLEPFWMPPEFPSFFSVLVETDNGKVVQYQKRSQPEVRLAVSGHIKAITINGDKSNTEWNKTKVHVYIPFLSLPV
jgi:hypothetical protein